jgi:DNA-binding MarR family transcriptional regulator
MASVDSGFTNIRVLICYSCTDMNDQLEIKLPRAGEGRRGETGHLGYLLRQAAAAFRSRMERALAGEGMTSPQFVVLTLVGAYPGISNADLSRLAHLTPQTVNAIVGRLKRAGAVASQPHSTHGRIQLLSLSALGVRLVARARPVVTRLEKQLETGLDAKGRQAVRRWLVRLATEGADDEQPKGAAASGSNSKKWRRRRDSNPR